MSAEEETTGGRQYGSIDHMVTLVRPRSPPWRKQLRNWLPGSPVDLIGLTPWYSNTRAPAMHHSLSRGTWAFYPQEGRGNSLWVDQSTGSLPTSHLWPTSCLPDKVKWRQRTHCDLPAGVSGQWHKPYWWHVCIPGNWHPAILCIWAGPKGTTYWWVLQHHDGQPP